MTKPVYILKVDNTFLQFDYWNDVNEYVSNQNLSPNDYAIYMNTENI